MSKEHNRNIAGKVMVITGAIAEPPRNATARPTNSKAANRSTNP